MILPVFDPKTGNIYFEMNGDPNVRERIPLTHFIALWKACNATAQSVFTHAMYQKGGAFQEQVDADYVEAFKRGEFTL